MNTKCGFNVSHSIPKLMQASLAAALILLLVNGAIADIPPSPALRETMKTGEQLIQRQLMTQFTNVETTMKELLGAYNARHPEDLWIETLSVKQLQRLVLTRSNDLAPRLLLLAREPEDDTDSQEWLANLKASYTLATNEPVRVTCLVLAMGGTFALEGKPFGKAMLRDLEQWLQKLKAQQPEPAVAEKIKYLQLFGALGTESYADVPVYAQGTPFRTLAPLWLMSKGKWELALKEVRQLKALPDLSRDEGSTLDAFESVLKGMTEKKPVN